MSVPAGTDSSKQPRARRSQPVPEPTNLLEELGALVKFVGTALVALPQALRYPVEVLRQTGLMIRGSAPVIVGFIVIGSVLSGEVTHYLLTQIGAQSYAGLAAAEINQKGAIGNFFGFIVAAKIGCGMVAELGSMRINEEVDAMDVMGIRPQVYLVGTRLVAFVIAGPILYLVGAALGAIAVSFVVVHVYGTTSAGQFDAVFWSVFDPGSYLSSTLVWAVIPSLLAVIVGCYYGLQAAGGAVGVGHNTAKAMIINTLVIIVIGTLIIYQIVYGTNRVLPIGN